MQHTHWDNCRPQLVLAKQLVIATSSKQQQKTTVAASA